MSLLRGPKATSEFLAAQSPAEILDLRTDHGISSFNSPYISTTKNPTVAQFFAKGPNQIQNGFVTTFKIEEREANSLKENGDLVPNLENPLAFFQINPDIGLPEAEFIFKNEIDPRYIHTQTGVS